MSIATLMGVLFVSVLGTSVTVGQRAPGYTVFVAQPSSDPAQPDHRITLHLTNVPIPDALQQIALQAGLELSWNRTKAPLDGKVTVVLQDVSLSEALQTILSGTGAEGKVSSDGQTIMIVPKVLGSATGHHIQSGVVAGRVTDSASGQGLGGAAIKVAGTRVSTVTSDSGNFTLRDVPIGDQILLVKLFGYRPAERKVIVVDSERTMVKIVLAPVPTVLSGVVTTAAGTQRKVEIGNDITSLNVDSIMQIAPVQTVTDLLETRVPGLTVLHSDGVPGDPSRLRLRGPGSVQGNNDPIVIVNGVRVYARQSDSRNENLSTQGNIAPSGLLNGLGGNVPSSFAAPSPIDQIDPADIETIEVFKGPSATAIYGSDAANGVIVITTKHGHVGPTRWTLGLGEGINWSPGQWPTNYYRFGYDSTVTSMRGTGLCEWYETNCKVDSIIPFQALNDPLYTVFAHGSDQQANLSISGGLAVLTYNLTGSGSGDIGLLKLPVIEQQRYDSVYGSTHGLIPNDLVRPDNYTTWGVSGSLTAQPVPALQVSVQSSLFTSNQQQGSLNGAILQLEGEYLSPVIVSQNPSPLIQNDVERVTDNQLSSTNALSLNWNVASWFPLNVTGGINTIQRMDENYVPFGIGIGGPGTTSGDTTGQYGLGRGTSRDQTLDVKTNIPLRLVTLALGANLYSESTSDFSVQTDQLAPGVSIPTTFLNSNGIPVSPTYSTFGQSTYGWFVQPTLNLHSRFFASPGFRFDGGSGGSTSSGSVGGLSAFPKIDLSYVAVDRQNGHPLWGILTLLRPRLAFGLAATQPLPQDRLRLFNVGTLNSFATNPSQNNVLTQFTQGCQSTLMLNDTTSVSAVCLDAIGNTQLRPERTRELEGGFDASLWQNRVQLTYTQYNKTTQDAILNIPTAPSIGFVGSYEKNIGEVRNTGTEVTVNAVVFERRALSWTVGANLSNDNNLVVRLNPGQTPICLGTVTNAGGPCSGERIVAGYPLFGEWAQPIASFYDANHDGIIEQNEIRYADSAVYVGQPNPKFQFNLTTDLTLFDGRVSIHATFPYVNGLTQFDEAAFASGALAFLPNAPNTPLGTEAGIAAAGYGAGLDSKMFTQIALYQTVNTFRFQDLSVNYTVPRAIAAWFRASRMTIALQGSNLALRTNYRGIDPDINAFGTVSAGDETADLGQIPEPRTWWLKLTVGN